MSDQSEPAPASGSRLARTPSNEQWRFKDELRAYESATYLPTVLMVLMIIALVVFLTFGLIYSLGSPEYRPLFSNLTFAFMIITVAFMLAAIYTQRPARLRPFQDKAEAQGRTFGQTVFREEYWQILKVNIDNGEVLARPKYPGKIELHDVEFYMLSTGDPIPRMRHSSGQGVSLELNAQIVNTPWYQDALQAAAGPATEPPASPFAQRM